MFIAKFFQNTTAKIKPQPINLVSYPKRSFKLAPPNAVWIRCIFPFFNLGEGLQLALTCKENYKIVEIVLGKNSLQNFLKKILSLEIDTFQEEISLTTNAIYKYTADDIEKQEKRKNTCFTMGMTGCFLGTIAGPLTTIAFGVKEYLNLKNLRNIGEKYANSIYQQYLASFASTDFWVNQNTLLAKNCIENCLQYYWNIPNPDYNPHKSCRSSDHSSACRPTIWKKCLTSIDPYCNEFNNPPFYANDTLCHDYFSACAPLNADDSWPNWIIAFGVILTTAAIIIYLCYLQKIENKIDDCCDRKKDNILFKKLNGSFVFKKLNSDFKDSKIIKTIIKNDSEITIGSFERKLNKMYWKRDEEKENFKRTLCQPFSLFFLTQKKQDVSIQIEEIAPTITASK